MLSGNDSEYVHAINDSLNALYFSLSNLCPPLFADVPTQVFHDDFH